ncbi:hypothetical protein LRS11_21680 [Pseudomonas sp. J452]|uniref:hypothetical protein n=1 Tax=Pseudomonas sp. J452 TaxID=2898441 RepID=UPI0021AE0929|nr:hypothetical protein [Pseudomonas sp. J452]UUY08368.1 hypothetical protein LRS11_21680 [Pseudomonas sp. J452]
MNAWLFRQLVTAPATPSIIKLNAYSMGLWRSSAPFLPLRTSLLCCLDKAIQRADKQGDGLGGILGDHRRGVAD